MLKHRNSGAKQRTQHVEATIYRGGGEYSCRLFECSEISCTMVSRLMKERAAKHEPFSAAELDGVLASLQRAAAAAAAAAAADSSSVEGGEGGGSSAGGGGAAPIDWATLRALLGEAAHLSHKDWVRTESAADSLGDILGGPANASFRAIFHRVLEDGKWDSADGAAIALDP